MATVSEQVRRGERPEHVRHTELGKPVTFLEAIREALWEGLERDEDTLILGEDVGVYGGAFKVTAGFIDTFGPDRIIDTPISEAGFTGLAAGAVHIELCPLVEMLFMDSIAGDYEDHSNTIHVIHLRIIESRDI